MILSEWADSIPNGLKPAKQEINEHMEQFGGA